MRKKEYLQKEIELNIREADLNKKEQHLLSSQSNKIKFDSTIIVALIAVAGSVIGYLIDSYNKSNQQQREFESTLIINAIQTGNSDISKNNLKFLVDVNLISDKAQKLKLNEIIKNPKYKISHGATSSWGDPIYAYICTDPTATKYHFSRKCRGLSNCSTELQKVLTDDAKDKYHRDLCGWED